MRSRKEPLRLFLVAGEHSGDRLGGALIQALRARSGRQLQLAGVGGESMQEEGCSSLFPLSDVAVMGPFAILKRLPTLIGRVRQTVDAAIAMKPDALVILDSPEFTHAVAKRVRRQLPKVPVIDYVSPSVWAWRPGRAKRMRAYVDHILAILPFEPQAHKQLGGPDCTYIGHPLVERLDWIRARSPENLRKRLSISKDRPVIAVLPGSRVNEISRMMPVYAQTLQRIIGKVGPVEVVIPLAPGCETLVKEALQDWPLEPHLLQGDDHKFTAFRLADAALATSGTVALELALSGTPMVVAYRTEAIVSLFSWMLRAHSIVLPNLVLGENVFPEFIQGNAAPETLADALLPLLNKTGTARKRQLEALALIEDRMKLPSGTPSERAADVVLDFVDSH